MGRSFIWWILRNDLRIGLSQARTKKTVVSIGSGPGNDMLGALVFLTVCCGSTAALHILGLDANARHWDKIISQLSPFHLHGGSVHLGSHDGASADFEPVSGQHHIQLRKVASFANEICDICGGEASHASVVAHMKAHGMPSPSTSPTLYTFSYVLTETKERWHDFFFHLYTHAAPQSFFYVAEPNPFQIFVLLGQFPSWTHGKDFFWLDSSLENPDLASTMQRLGPAVMLIVKH